MEQFPYSPLWDDTREFDPFHFRDGRPSGSGGGGGSYMLSDAGIEFGGGGGRGFNDAMATGDPALAAPMGNLSALLGDLDGNGDISNMGDLFKTLLFLQGQRGGASDNSPFGLFSGIQL